MWKLKDFSFTHILRKINFGESRSYKTVDFAILGVLNFVRLGNSSPQKVQKFTKNQNSEPLNVLTWQILHF